MSIRKRDEFLGEARVPKMPEGIEDVSYVHELCSRAGWKLSTRYADGYHYSSPDKRFNIRVNKSPRQRTPHIDNKDPFHWELVDTRSWKGVASGRSAEELEQVLATADQREQGDASRKPPATRWHTPAMPDSQGKYRKFRR